MTSVTWPDGGLVLVAEVKGASSPRLVREVVVPQLRRYRAAIPGSYGVFIAPYISPAVAAICERAGFGYMDLAGNCLITFSYVYVRREGRPNPAPERRELRSLYSPKAERVIRVLLNRPAKAWKLIELAQKAEVSVGQVHRVKELLVDREWMTGAADGFRLLEPGKLLREWAENYDYGRNQSREFYLMKSLPEIEAAVAEGCEHDHIHYALTGFSGAARHAPFVRYQRASAYVLTGVDQLAHLIGLKEVSSGGNLTLLEPYDEGVLHGAKEQTDGFVTVSPVQNYLDLRSLRGRGEEAASALLEQVIEPQW
jgi:Transcriptional regulator, AbiEi antitoxin, Type IV TA system